MSLLPRALHVADININKLAFPTKLRDLLESSNSTKVGVGIQCKWASSPFSYYRFGYRSDVRTRAFIWVGKCLDDCKKLWRDHRVSVRNCVDLALLARSVDKSWKGPYKGGIGLSRLAEIYLGRYLAKGDTQRSNWEMELSTRQQECE